MLYSCPDKWLTTNKQPLETIQRDQEKDKQKQSCEAPAHLTKPFKMHEHTQTAENNQQ